MAQTWRIDRADETVQFTSQRISADGRPASFAATFAPVGEARPAARGSLDYFLAERYCLYTTDEQGALLRGEIQHPAWPLQSARATISRNSMTLPWGIKLPPTPPILHFAQVQQVLIWPLDLA